MSKSFISHSAFSSECHINKQCHINEKSNIEVLETAKAQNMIQSHNTVALSYSRDSFWLVSNL